MDSRSLAGESLSAMTEILDLLANDGVLRPLGHATIEDKAIGGDRFGGNFRCLLKLCSE